MPFVTHKSLIGLGILAVVGVGALGAFAWSGIYNVGADDAHTAPVHAFLDMARTRSIATRASKIEVPDLSDQARIRQGAGNYAAMCAGCHLSPEAAPTEMSGGLYPAPPNLTQVEIAPAEAFWAIKHGLKASGMPAWGRSMNDAYIWNMVAFLQALPKMDAAGYRSMVAASGGHSHGGGETAPHADAAPEQSAEDESKEHVGNRMPASASTVPAHGEAGHHH